MKVIFLVSALDQGPRLVLWTCNNVNLVHFLKWFLTRGCISDRFRYLKPGVRQGDFIFSRF